MTRYQVKHRVDRLVAFVLMVLLSVLTLAVSWQVLSRYALGTPATATEEVARFSFLWLSFLGAAYVVGQKKHLAVDLISAGRSPTQALWLGRLVTAMGLLFISTVLVFGGFYLLHVSFELGQRSPVLGLSLGYVYAVVPIAGVLGDFYLLTADIQTASEVGVSAARPEDIS